MCSVARKRLIIELITEVENVFLFRATFRAANLEESLRVNLRKSKMTFERLLKSIYVVFLYVISGEVCLQESKRGDFHDCVTKCFENNNTNKTVLGFRN